MCLCPRQDSNLHHQNRNLTFYPIELRRHYCYAVNSFLTIVEIVLPSADPANLVFAKPIT